MTLQWRPDASQGSQAASLRTHCLMPARVRLRFNTSILAPLPHPVLASHIMVSFCHTDKGVVPTPGLYGRLLARPGRRKGRKGGRGIYSAVPQCPASAFRIPGAARGFVKPACRKRRAPGGPVVAPRSNAQRGVAI